MKTKWTASELKAMSREEIDKLYEIVTWYEGLRETNNETFLPLFADTHRYLVLKGGGGSGKSIFAGRKVLERAVNEPGHRFLVCRKVARTLRERAASSSFWDSWRSSTRTAGTRPTNQT